MQLSISSDEIAVSPEPVRDWFASKLGLTIPPASDPVSDKPAKEAKPIADKPAKEAKQTKPKDAKPVEAAKPTPPTAQEVLERAVAFLESHGEEALKAVLGKVGIARVKECPEEKRAALLAEIAVYEIPF